MYVRDLYFKVQNPRNESQPFLFFENAMVSYTCRIPGYLRSGASGPI